MGHFRYAKSPKYSQSSKKNLITKNQMAPLRKISDNMMSQQLHPARNDLQKNESESDSQKSIITIIPGATVREFKAPAIHIEKLYSKDEKK